MPGIARIGFSARRGPLSQPGNPVDSSQSPVATDFGARQVVMAA